MCGTTATANNQQQLPSNHNQQPTNQPDNNSNINNSGSSDGQLSPFFTHHTSAVWSIAIVRGGGGGDGAMRVASGDDSSYIFVWQLTTGSPTLPSPTPNNTLVSQHMTQQITTTNMPRTCAHASAISAGSTSNQAVTQGSRRTHRTHTTRRMEAVRFAPRNLLRKNKKAHFYVLSHRKPPLCAYKKELQSCKTMSENRFRLNFFL